MIPAIFYSVPLEGDVSVPVLDAPCCQASADEKAFSQVVVAFSIRSLEHRELLGVNLVHCERTCS